MDGRFGYVKLSLGRPTSVYPLAKDTSL